MGVVLSCWVVGRVAAWWVADGDLPPPPAHARDMPRRAAEEHPHTVSVDAPFKAAPKPSFGEDEVERPTDNESVSRHHLLMTAATPSVTSPLQPDADIGASLPPSPRPISVSALGDDRPYTQSLTSAPSLAFAPPAPANRSAHLSGSGWLLARASGPVGLGNSGQLGGSQAGLRVNYGLGHGPFSFTARLSTPLDAPSGKEAAIGVALAPFRRLPVTLIAEQRIAADSGGRTDFEIIAAGGIYDRNVGHRLAVTGYVQAGVVGIRAHDLFIDGALALDHSLAERGHTRLSVGAALWGAAQPDVARLDAGPDAALRFRVGSVNVKAEASYRVRLAGSARPATGPAFSLGTDF